MEVTDIHHSIQTMTLVPNPAKGASTLVVDLRNGGNSQLTITDMSGRTLLQKQGSMAAGLQQIALPVGNLASGIYFVTLSVEGQKLTSKLVIQ